MVAQALETRLYDLVGKVKTVVDLDTALTEITQLLGFQYFALSHHVDISKSRGKAIRLHNYPQIWVDHYDKRALGVIDPVHSLDTYVADAGLWDFHKRVERQTPEELTAAYHEIFGVNVLGAIYGAHAALPALKTSGGSVIVTGSNACFLAGGGGALYTASKFALRGLVLQMAKEFAPMVRVNGVAPGATRTPLSGPEALGQANREMDADAGRIAAIPDHVPLGRISEPEDHTDLYVMLAAKSESRYITGTMMLSDGGLTISV